jgi:hypothetical protein
MSHFACREIRENRSTFSEMLSTMPILPARPVGPGGQILPGLRAFGKSPIPGKAAQTGATAARAPK